MSRAARRDRDAERAAIRAAAGRLLAGTPLRSATGKLTGTELITECGLRRDVVYGDHKDLVEEFQAQVKAQQFTPLAPWTWRPSATSWPASSPPSGGN